MMVSLKHYAEERQGELFELLRTLCAIPAPSNHEEQRAAFCLKWLGEQGITDAHIDPALNVVWPYRVREGEQALVIMAHTDTVFPDREPFSVRVEDGRAYCPGIADDTVNVAVLMLLMRYMFENQPETECGILFVLNSGEEGLGNLKGSRQILSDYRGQVREFISLDGSQQSIITGAVGSVRYRISIETEGGHSYSAFGNRNAIERAARLVSRLYAVKVPEKEGTRTTYNVGGIQGGTSINTIAQHAELLYEYRSSDRECLKYMGERLEEILEESRKECLSLKVEVLGERPCSAELDEAHQEALVNRCREAMQVVCGVEEPGLYAASTDCNIPLSLGIPSICFGMGGHGAHTYEEYMEMDALPSGFQLIARVLGSYIRENE